MSTMKTKFKISQLAAKAIDVELIHPEHNKTGIMVELVGPHSKVFQEAKAVYETTDGTAADNIRLFSACIVGWDSECMEMDWSVENSFNYFSKPENTWAVQFLSPIIRDELNFYAKK